MLAHSLTTAALTLSARPVGRHAWPATIQVLYPLQSVQGAFLNIDTEVNEPTILSPRSPTIGIEVYSLVGDVVRLVPHENCTGAA